MVKCEWNNYPVHRCDRLAKHFCRSLVKESVDIKPAHRAFCDECFNRLSQSNLLNMSEEISAEEWTLLRPEVFSY